MAKKEIVETTTTVEKEGSKFGWGILGFFFPLVGLILFLVWKKNKKKAAKASGIGALVGFLLGLVSTIIMFALGFGTLVGIGVASDYYENTDTKTKTEEKKKDDTKEESKTEEKTTPSGIAFVNTDGAYYTYEGKSFIGTGVDNVILSSIITGTGNVRDEFTTYTTPEEFNLAYNPVADEAKAYCTGCRLMTKDEALAWGCPLADTWETNDKCKIEYNGTTEIGWWLNDFEVIYREEISKYLIQPNIVEYGRIYNTPANSMGGIRPAVTISSSATMTGTGTQTDPYVISQ